MTRDRLDDPDFPAYTTGQAAQVLGVRQAFLRALDAAGAVIPVRSGGGHRRCSRGQLVFARRVRELFDQGHNLASALRILSLQDDLATERDLTASLRDQLNNQRGEAQDPAVKPEGGPGPEAGMASPGPPAIVRPDGGHMRDAASVPGA